MKFNSKVEIYVSSRDFPIIKQSFPYLVDTEKASGSGYVSKIKFIVFEPNSKLNIFGLEIQTFTVSSHPQHLFSFLDVC